MDGTFFGLERRPFRTTPDAASYYAATGHEQALARLHQAIDDDEGLALLTGEPGTGKTLLCHRLIELLGPDVATAFLTNSHCRDRAGLLQALLYDLSLPYLSRGEQELRLALTDYLLKNFGAGKRALFLIDEAQHLTPDLLEELRLLGNLEAKHGKAVQIILIAQPTLGKTLRLPELASFGQRLLVRCKLEALDVHEAADFLYHQLRLAGGRPEQILSGEAAELLARATRGVPRLLNQAAYQALALAQDAGCHYVDAEAAIEALALLGLDVEEGDEEPANLSTLIQQSSSEAEGEETEPAPVLSLTEPAAETGARSDMAGAERVGQRPA
jgi:general secretion pathway protein A